MIQTGMDEQIHKLIENMDNEAAQASKVKRLRDGNNNGNDVMERNVKRMKIQQNDVSTQTTTDFSPIFLDSDEDEPEYLPPDYTIYRKSFYE
jgi:hypothetical protein